MVLVAGLPLVVLIWMYIYAQTPGAGLWVERLLGREGAAVPEKALDAEAVAAAERARAYVRRYVAIETDTRDQRVGATGDMVRLEVRVRLRNGGTQTVSEIRARVMVRLVPSMAEPMVEIRNPLLAGVSLKPGDLREFTVVFDGLKAEPGDDARIRVELIEPELEPEAQ